MPFNLASDFFLACKALTSHLLSPLSSFSGFHEIIYKIFQYGLKNVVIYVIICLI